MDGVSERLTDAGVAQGVPGGMFYDMVNQESTLSILAVQTSAAGGWHAARLGRFLLLHVCAAPPLASDPAEVLGDLLVPLAVPELCSAQMSPRRALQDQRLGMRRWATISEQSQHQLFLEETKSCAT